MNPLAMNFWIFSTAFGYAVNASQGAAIGLVIASGLSLIISFKR